MHAEYRIGDKVIPSVTQIIRLGSSDMSDFANYLGMQGINNKEYMSDLAMIGTITHQYIEQKLTNQKTDFSDLECSEEQINRAKICIEKFDEWFSYQDFELIESEKSLVSEKYGYGGTLDCICKLNGENVLIDWKTSSSIDDSYKVQLSAYKNMAEEHGYKIDKCIILRIGRKESEPFQYYEVTKNDIELGFKLFQLELALYNGLEEFKAKKSKGRKKKGQ